MELIKCPMMIKISAYNDILYSSYLEKEARFPLLNAGILGAGLLAASVAGTNTPQFMA